MEMSASTMSMTVSATGTAAAAATSSAMSDMAMDMNNDCKISMLWNWYTIDACFLSSSWQIKSHGMFAGSCIGVICLVLSLEFFRRLAKEYDRYLVRHSIATRRINNLSTQSDSDDLLPQSSGNKGGLPARARSIKVATGSIALRPSIVQQIVRAGLHATQFGIAYIVMLLAMYYNGYFIISIFLGAFIGSFIFNWEKLGTSIETQDDPTVCCG